MYVSLYIYIYVHTCIFVHMCMYVSISIYMYIYCVYTYLYVCWYVCMYRCVCMPVAIWAQAPFTSASSTTSWRRALTLNLWNGMPQSIYIYTCACVV